MKIKVGDKVKIVAEYSGFYNKVGWVTQVVSDSLFAYTIVFNGAENYAFFAEDELELIQ